MSLTLGNRTDEKPLEPGRCSVGGSMRIDVEYPPGRNVKNPGPNLEKAWIVIRDLQTGIERSRINPPVSGIPVRANMKSCSVSS